MLRISITDDVTGETKIQQISSQEVLRGYDVDYQVLNPRVALVDINGNVSNIIVLSSTDDLRYYNQKYIALSDTEQCNIGQVASIKSENLAQIYPIDEIVTDLGQIILVEAIPIDIGPVEDSPVGDGVAGNSNVQ